MGTCCWRRGKDGSGRSELALTEKEDVDPFLRGEELGVGLDIVMVKEESQAGGRNLESLAPGVWEARDRPRSLGHRG